MTQSSSSLRWASALLGLAALAASGTALAAKDAVSYTHLTLPTNREV